MLLCHVWDGGYPCWVQVLASHLKTVPWSSPPRCPKKLNRLMFYHHFRCYHNLQRLLILAEPWQVSGVLVRVLHSSNLEGEKVPLTSLLPVQYNSNYLHSQSKFLQKKASMSVFKPIYFLPCQVLKVKSQLPGWNGEENTVRRTNIVKNTNKKLL